MASSGVDVPKFPVKFHDDVYADHSIAAALDGDYTRLRQRLLTITQEELNLIAEARRRGCKECRVQLVTREELECIEAILEELQSEGRVATPRAKINDARGRDNIALMVLEVQVAMQRHHGVSKGFREEAYDYVQHSLCGRLGYRAIKDATQRFLRDPHKRAFADEMIPKLLDLDVQLWCSTAT
jgi:hypothetical protein